MKSKVKKFEIKTDIEIQIEKENKMLNLIGDLASFYREHPHEFAIDYLGIPLRPFQKILLYVMFHKNMVNIIACRGLGKSWLIAVYAVVKCILYPGSKVCVTSSKLKQAIEVLKKITNDLMINNGAGSDRLKAEIKKFQFHGEDPMIMFNNGSFIYAVAANQNARSKRSTDNIYDEYVQMDPDIIRDVLEPFLTVKRQVGFINTPKYEKRTDLIEENKQFYLSSAWYKSEWSFTKVRDYFSSMLVGQSFFSCALPYQLSIESGLMSETVIRNVYNSSDFNSVKFAMEYEAIWYGSTGSEFFTYDEIKPRRTLTDAYPSSEVIFNKKNKVKIHDLKFNQKRILSVDVALIEGKKNDAAVLIINDAILNNKNEYIANIKYIEAFEGLRTEQLGMKVMKIYHKFNCNCLVVDARGNGQGVLDFLTIEQEDSKTGEKYLPFKAINNEVWANRTVGKKFIETLWVINATEKINDEAAYRVKNALDNNKISLPVSEYECEQHLIENVSGYAKKTDLEQLKYRKTYLETTLLVNEMINLEQTIRKNLTVLSEKSGMRKDRYSSLAYNIWVMKELEKKNKPKSEKPQITFKARKPNYSISW